MNKFTRPAFLDGKSVVWVSSKATDATFLLKSGLDLSVVSLVGSPLELEGSTSGFTLETFENHRYDYDTFGWDSLTAPQATPIINIIEKLDDVIILPFSSSGFVSNLELEFDHVKVAGNPHLLEQVFNNKPWVETQVRLLDIKTPDWKYLMSVREHSITDDESSWVTRLSDMSGGLGMQKTNRPGEDATSLETKLSKDILSVAPFIDDAISLNISACVFPSGDITLHPLSLQIIGSSVCTDRRFGYCGNDFGVAAHLSEADIQQISLYTKRIGEWLRSYGYIGAFGIDYMFADGVIYFSELNPRFQASSHIGAELMDNLGYQNIYLDHLAAHMGIAPTHAADDLVDITQRQLSKSQIFVYNTELSDEAIAKVTEASMKGIDLEWKSATIEQHGLLFRLYKDVSVMSDGKSLNNDILSELAWHKLRIAARMNNNES